MFNLVYLPAEEREELRIRRDRREKIPRTSKEYEANEGRIQEIEAHSKPLRECTAEEAADFRRFIVDRVRRCRAIGKLGQAAMFDQQRVWVDNHLRTVQLRGALESEASKRQREEQRVKVEMRGESGSGGRKAKTRGRKPQNQWTLDIGDLE